MDVKLVVLDGNIGIQTVRFTVNVRIPSESVADTSLEINFVYATPEVALTNFKACPKGRMKGI